MIKFKSKIVSFLLGFGVVLIVLYSCKGDEENKETILTGSTSILVDESILPIIEDQVAVFESQYNATIKLLPQSEKESVQSFVNNTARTIILSRKLNIVEKAIFKNKKITPLETPFAIDAIALIKNKISKDSIQDISEIVAFLKGNPTKIKGLVFDNANSSTTRYFLELAGLKSMPDTGVFSFKTNEEVIQYVSQNEGMIGVVGINWIFQPRLSRKKILEKITVLSIKDKNTNGYVYPSQENIASRKYPLARVLYIVNCQGFEGLGIGFASFISGEIGQRIILKSGLAPLREPSRNISIRNKIESN
ncbi:PstS family phosphate ABC transporter substrate-binding protein [Flavobacterium sp.]|jgi:phosphate transport system substrate-binding protein|uniref:PstS family phosphate ABC transporter substrate-binding protein n=1 Tax=Flavobacterium sp. TaxID=239 RepID=UPI0037C1421C